MYLTEQRITTKLLQKALFKFMDLQFMVVYKAGSSNYAAHDLSRCHFTHPVMAVSTCQPDWVTKVMLGYEEDSKALGYEEDSKALKL